MDFNRIHILNGAKMLRAKVPVIFRNYRRRIFCIGFGKTGTTSLKLALQELGFKIGNQEKAELLIDHYEVRNFKPIIRYCWSAEAFQDSPFSLPYTFIAMDQAFPNSKFVLTVRNSSEDWYNSLLKFHTKLFGRNGEPPTVKDLKNARYRYKGYVYHSYRIIYGDEHPLYDREHLIKTYQSHIAHVNDYFRYRPKDLLTLNPGDPEAYSKLCSFLDKSPGSSLFPWENKTSEIT